MVEITVLFADLSGFTELTHELGAEKTHEVVDAFLRMGTEVLVRHGAFIDKYVGDAVMAIFNVPIRHPDHSHRAIRAGLELADELKSLARRLDLPLLASVGIASGYARVGRLGSDDSKDYTAIGDVVNLAARLQAKAGAGEILVAENALAATATESALGVREQLVLKGFRDPVWALRLHEGPLKPFADDPPEDLPGQRASVGAMIFGVLGAPCAVATLIGPAAVALGVGGLFGLAGALTFLDQSIIRIPVLALASLAALANLYTLWQARLMRMESRVPEQLKSMTLLETRRTAIVLATAATTLAIVGFEIIAHKLMH